MAILVTMGWPRHHPFHIPYVVSLSLEESYLLSHKSSSGGGGGGGGGRGRMKELWPLDKKVSLIMSDRRDT